MDGNAETGSGRCFVKTRLKTQFTKVTSEIYSIRDRLKISGLLLGWNFRSSERLGTCTCTVHYCMYLGSRVRVYIDQHLWIFIDNCISVFPSTQTPFYKATSLRHTASVVQMSTPSERPPERALQTNLLRDRPKISCDPTIRLPFPKAGWLR